MYGSKVNPQQKQRAQGPIQMGNLNGAAIINDNGEEIPITEKMILDACEELSRYWWYPRKTRS